MEMAFRASSHHKTLINDLAAYGKEQTGEEKDQEAFRAAVMVDMREGATKKSPHTFGFAG